MHASRVLVVEDEFFVALELELLIHKQAPSVQVVICSSVSDARAAMAEPVGLALLDIDVLDGKTYEVAARLAEQGTPIVFISGSRPEEIPPTLRDVHFIPKPYHGPQIIEAIAPLLASGAHS
ncbi:response regulator [Salinarimonas soli]|uniref:response regulator n=1 Tax=Salinarimonas soli TaxID=1638099 RepID=UPI001661F3FF|nr:response regulator [Salinarimonas soli]